MSTAASDLTYTTTVRCPECGGTAEVDMPTTSCQYFWECPTCETMLTPEPGDCCVFCSYGRVACPPVQQEQKGCC
jgi:hypothetical protein